VPEIAEMLGLTSKRLLLEADITSAKSLVQPSADSTCSSPTNGDSSSSSNVVAGVRIARP
jgi:hypothetical protein